MCKESFYLSHSQCSDVAQAKRLPFFNGTDNESAWCIFNGSAWSYLPTLTMCNSAQDWPSYPNCLTRAAVCHQMMTSRAGGTRVAFQRWWHPWFSDHGYCILLDITKAQWKVLWTNNPTDRALCHTYVCHCADTEPERVHETLNSYESYDSYLESYEEERYEDYDETPVANVSQALDRVTCFLPLRQRVLFTWASQCLHLAAQPDPTLIKNLTIRGRCCPQSLMLS